MSSLETHYSAIDIEARILAGLRAAGLNPDQRLSPEELGALDHFHTGGLQASRELLDLARIRADHKVLDIGAGLAGCARFIASQVGCRVDCLEMSADYCSGAELLNRLTNLEDQVKVHQGSAVDLPFHDEAFDIVWMQNVGMNISDKQKLYEEIARVIKPGGRFVFQEVTAGQESISFFPLPWASDTRHNFLLTADEMIEILSRFGFTPELFEDVSGSQFSTGAAHSTPSPAGQLGLAVYVDNLAEKAGNARRSLEAGQVRYVRGVFRAN